MSFDFTKAIDARCSTTNNYTSLVITSASTVSLLMLLTIPLNALVVFALIKEQKRQSLFYKLLLNIAIVDLLTGLVADPNVVNSLVKEALRAKLSMAEVYSVHLSLFFTEAVALCTLTLLSIDRILAIVSPVKHFKGMKKITQYRLVVSTWICAACLLLPYFKIGFIRQLFVFCIINIAATFVSLIVTIIMYRIKLKPTVAGSAKVEKGHQVINNRIHKAETSMDSFSLQNPSTKSTFTEICVQTERKDTNLDNLNTKSTVSKVDGTQGISNEKGREIKLSNFPSDTVNTDETARNVGENFVSKQQARIQQRATRAFLVMLCVFLVTYLPTAVTMIFMNVCTTCNCMTVHIMRDVSSISILSSSVFRPLSFILTLRHLRTTVLFQLGISKRNKNKKDKNDDETKNTTSR